MRIGARSWPEIQFRLTQEFRNSWNYLRAPSNEVQADWPLAMFPSGNVVAKRLSGSSFAAQCVQLGDQVVVGEWPLLGRVIPVGNDVRWRKDYLGGTETGLTYFRRIPYLDSSLAGDHKVVWEMSRHQQLVVLAQAWLFTGDEKYLTKLWALLESWWEQNPFLAGINWTSALEVAFRALSWVWIYHWVGDRMPGGFRRRFLLELYRHGVYLHSNLSIYFSPNTHLLGEAVVLHALGKLFGKFPGAGQWAEVGREWTLKCMDFQVQDDGSYFEQSSYYHVYGLDFFALHHVIEPAADGYVAKLGKMAGYLCALMGPQRRLAFFGDDDGGRLFHPFGDRRMFGRASLATAAVLTGRGNWTEEDWAEQGAWWIGDATATGNAFDHEPRYFEASGVWVRQPLLFKTGTFGYGRGGHSHSDVLSLSIDGVLIDPGTYTYVSNIEWRNWFRGAGAHNTVRVDGMDQGEPAGPFGWNGKPAVEVLRRTKDLVEAAAEYRGVRHVRTVRFESSSEIHVHDRLTGGEGIHSAEQLWHCEGPVSLVSPGIYSIGGDALLELDSEADVIEGWAATAHCEKRKTEIVRAKRQSQFPIEMNAIIRLAKGSLC